MLLAKLQWPQDCTVVAETVLLVVVVAVVAVLRRLPYAICCNTATAQSKAKGLVRLPHRHGAANPTWSLELVCHHGCRSNCPLCIAGQLCNIKLKHTNETTSQCGSVGNGYLQQLEVSQVSCCVATSPRLLTSWKFSMHSPTLDSWIVF